MFWYIAYGETMDNDLLKSGYSLYGKMLKCPTCVLVNRVIDDVISKVPSNMEIEKILLMDFENAICNLKSVFQDTSDMSYLFSEENIVFKILFVIERYFYVSSVYCFFLLVVLLKYEDLYDCVILFQPKWFRLLKFDSSNERNAYFMIMKWMDEQLHKEIDFVHDESLLEYYPFLQKEQVVFYLAHRKSGCFYTIEKYKEFNKVCYETARLHLEQLVSLGWYKKQKVGKKFVYSV